MGLDIRPGDASWSYRGFHEFRKRLAAAEGFDLDMMRGFGGSREWETTNGDHFTPLAPLLHHSDCDGYLESEECEQALPRLVAILGTWADHPDAAVRYDVEQGWRLVAAMEHSIEHGCAVRFL